MASETVVAAKILCEARNRQKFREIGQNFSHDNSMVPLQQQQQQLCGNPTRHQSMNKLKNVSNLNLDKITKIEIKQKVNYNYYFNYLPSMCV